MTFRALPAALIAAILARQPWLVGFTCYVWNIERTLWIAAQLKRCQPDLRIVLGGPEITADTATQDPDGSGEPYLCESCSRDVAA